MFDACLINTHFVYGVIVYAFSCSHFFGFFLFNNHNIFFLSPASSYNQFTFSAPILSTQSLAAGHTVVVVSVFVQECDINRARRFTGK